MVEPELSNTLHTALSVQVIPLISAKLEPVASQITLLSNNLATEKKTSENLSASIRETAKKVDEAANTLSNVRSNLDVVNRQISIFKKLPDGRTSLGFGALGTPSVLLDELNAARDAYSRTNYQAGFEHCKKGIHIYEETKSILGGETLNEHGSGTLFGLGAECARNCGDLKTALRWAPLARGCFLEDGKVGRGFSSLLYSVGLTNQAVDALRDSISQELSTKPTNSLALKFEMLQLLKQYDRTNELAATVAGFLNDDSAAVSNLKKVFEQLGLTNEADQAELKLIDFRIQAETNQVVPLTVEKFRVLERLGRTETISSTVHNFLKPLLPDLQAALAKAELTNSVPYANLELVIEEMKLTPTNSAALVRSNLVLLKTVGREKDFAPTFKGFITLEAAAHTNNRALNWLKSGLSSFTRLTIGLTNDSWAVKLPNISLFRSYRTFPDKSTADVLKTTNVWLFTIPQLEDKTTAGSSFIFEISSSTNSANLLMAQLPGCCAKAKKEGKECTHPCCVEAKKVGKTCDKCASHQR